MKTKIKTVCKACGLKAEGETEGGSLPTWCSKSGWGCYMDVSNGLTFVTVCPECKAKLVPALKTIHSIFGADSAHIHFRQKQFEGKE